jgi:hypothetical protein
MSLFFMLIVVTGAALLAYYYWREDGEQRRDENATRLFLIWVAKGLLIPLLLWTFFNSGWAIDALFPKISQAKAAGKWWRWFAPATAGFLFYASCWWSAITLAWIAARVCLRTEKRIDFFSTGAVWMLFALPAAFFIVLLMGMGGVGFAATVCAASVVHGTLRIAPFDATRELGPTYSRALAKIAFDKFNEAEMEIIRQLEKAENDFDGWMLLAELYAIHFHDLKTAEQTICEICDDPNTNAAQVSIALNRLADWHLKLDNNPANARWALEKLCQRLTGTHMATMARRRIEQLPASREDYIARQNQGHTVKLLPVDEHQPLTSGESRGREQWARASEDNSMRMTPVRPKPTSREIATQEANECVERLTANPNDIGAREYLATLLAESLDRVASAIEQLDLLLAMPNQPENQRANWLMTQANWHVRLRNDLEAARAIWQRVVAEFPQSHEAFDAQRRIYLTQVDSAVRLRRRPPPGTKLTTQT